MPHTTPPASASSLCKPRTLLKGATITLCVNTGIALMLWWANTGPLDEQMVYSQAIGLSIWALINAGAVWLARPGDPGGFPRGWRMALLVPGGVLLGATIGTTLGNLYAKHPGQLLVTTNPRMAWMLLVMTFVVGCAMTLYFYLAGKSNYLQAELERTQRQTSEAQLRLLESQLEPHMLFNTLANLRVLISLDPVRAQTMLDHIIAYLRATLSASRHGPDSPPHTLEAEFARLGDYLALMAIRMGPRLQVTLDLPDALRHAPIPPLLLQPLAENAIQHGLEPKVEGGHLTIRASQHGPHLRLEVTDTGLGCPQLHTGTDPATASSATDSMPDSHASQHTSGFGLTQVRERLATAYGDQATFELLANHPTGTTANVQINHIFPA